VTIWDQVLEKLRAGMPAEDFRRWFGATAYASDSGDQVTVWVPSEAIRRHLDNQYRDAIKRAFAAVGRSPPESYRLISFITCAMASRLSRARSSISRRASASGCRALCLKRRGRRPRSWNDRTRAPIPQCNERAVEG